MKFNSRIKTISIISIFMILITALSCSKEKDSILVFKVNYGKSDWNQEGLIKGSLFSGGIETPLYSDLKSDKTGKIIISDLQTGTYRFEYFVKPYSSEGDYWPIAKDTVFQYREETTMTIQID